MLTYQKKGSVGYTAVGSPTIVDGVASGFSENDYIQTNSNVSAVSSLVLHTKIYCTDKDAYRVFVGCSANATFAIARGSANKLVLQFGNGSSFTINEIGTTVLSENTDYYVKLTYENATAKLFLRTDGTAWNEECSASLSAFPAGIRIWLGRGYQAAVYFRGEIDLSETYIKVNGQVWFGTQVLVPGRVCLQGPVGYTVVGSPVIADGVVSGFSSSDYLALNNSYSGEQFLSNFEIQISIKDIVGMCSLYTGKSDWTGAPIILLNRQSKVMILGSGLTPRTSQTALQANTNHKIRFKTNGIKGICQIYNENNLIEEFDTPFNGSIPPLQNTALFGKSADGAYNGCKIDLNQTYIKVNGKLWFGKQQANTVTCNGTTVWSHV